MMIASDLPGPRGGVGIGTTGTGAYYVDPVAFSQAMNGGGSLEPENRCRSRVFPEIQALAGMALGISAGCVEILAGQSQV
jgi:hypothetical protein